MLMHLLVVEATDSASDETKEVCVEFLLNYFVVVCTSYIKVV